jgi:hypothetical protein
MRGFLKSNSAIYFALFLTSFFVSLQSPLAPYAKSLPWTDSSVFIYIAKSILNGKVVYRDVFDHKGPFLYLINIIGLVLSGGKGFWGIWLLQLIALFITSIFLYKTSILFFNKIISLLVISVLLLFQSSLDVGGNVAESWAVPLMSVSLFIFSRYFTTKKDLTWVHLSVLSVTFTLTFLLRANLVLMWGFFGTAIIFDSLMRKQFANILKYLIIVTSFIIITIIPFGLYFYFNDSIEEALFGMLGFNFKYSAGTDPEMLKSMVFGFFSSIFIIVPIAIFSLISIFKYDRQNYTLYDLTIIISIIMIFVSSCLGRPAMHYLVQIIPLLIIPLGYCYTYLYDSLSYKKVLITLIVFFSLTSVVILSSAKKLIRNYYINNTEISERDVFKLIINNTGENDKILVIGNSTNYYLFSNRMSSSKYPFCYPIIEKDRKIEDEYCTELIDKKPKVIIIDFFWEVLDVRIKQRIKKILDDNYNYIDRKINNINIWIRKDCSFVDF